MYQKLTRICLPPFTLVPVRLVPSLLLTNCMTEELLLTIPEKSLALKNTSWKKGSAPPTCSPFEKLADAKGNQLIFIWLVF